MQNDEVIWQIINQGFCSFKTKIARERTFCQNPYNVTGLCLRSACPLANSQYATIREEDGNVYLFVKTIERAHTPKYLWEKIKLPDSYTKALELVSKQLEFFPKYLVHRNKQRLTKIHQMLIRMRKLKLKARPKIVTTNTKLEQREKGRERKALKAAQLDRAIEKELLDRLKQATTEGSEIFNYPEQQYTKVLNKAASKFKSKGEKDAQLEDPDEEEEEYEDEEGEDAEYEEEDELEEEEDEEEDGEVNDYDIEYIEDFDESDMEDEDEEIEDLGDYFNNTNSKNTTSSSSSSGDKKRKLDDDVASAPAGKKGKKDESTGKKSGKKGGKRGGTRVEIEYEDEVEEEEPIAQKAKNASSKKATANMDFNF